MSVSAVHASYVGAVLADNPFAYYRFNESTNTSPVVDQRGGNPGTFKNVPTVPVPGALPSDVAGTAATFSRTASQYVQLTTMGNFGSTMGNGFSVEFWMKTTDSTDIQSLYGAANSGGFLTDFISDIGHAGVAGNLRLYFRDDGNHRYETISSLGGGNVNLFNNQWHHVVQVYDPAASALADRVLFYTDGVRQSATVTIAGGGANPTLSDFNVPMALAADNTRGTIGDYYQGSLDEVAFYTTTLSAAQVLNHYQAAIVPEPSTLAMLAGGLGILFSLRRQRAVKPIACSAWKRRGTFR